MAEDSTPSYGTQAGDRREGRDNAGRGGRQAGPREPGGLRIRLSDNEMKAARALQEAFGLRSPVAVLGFALRTLAQQLEEGQLDALVAQQRNEGAGRVRPRGDEGGNDRRERRERGDRGGQPRQVRIDPFARPSKPPAPEPPPTADGAEEDLPGAPDDEAQPLLTSDADGVETEAVSAATDSPAAEPGAGGAEA